MKKKIVFWDIDGVLSIPTKENANDYVKFGRGLPAWPIAIAVDLVRLVHAHPQLRNIWLSSWGSASVIWNERADTPAWPVGYQLTFRQAAYARKVLPTELYSMERRVDRKLIAAQYHLRYFPEDQQVVWVEDGFATETEEWAARRGNVRLVDTSEDMPACAALLAREPTPEKAALAFIDTFLCGK